MIVDKHFEEYFNGRLHQVFFYITDVCQLYCEQCLYKTTLANREMDFQVALEMLEIYRSYGATKLTFIGGEPTLYGRKEKNKPLFEIIDKAKDLGYKYIRLDSNGQFKDNLLENISFQKLDNLSFSLDGHTAEINDALRGKGTFDKSLKNLQKAVKLGYYATITACIHPRNLDFIEEMIQLAISFGAKEFNMHPLFKMGIDRDNFSGEAHIEPKDWIDTYEEIRRRIDANSYPIPIRLPKRFIASSEYEANPDMYNYCPVKMGERILVHPDGQIRICALCIGSPYHIASYTRDTISFGAPASSNEISLDRIKRKPCMSQIKDFDGLTPLCISYKPFQLEHVWVTQHFDEKYLGVNNPTYGSSN